MEQPEPPHPASCFHGDGLLEIIGAASIHPFFLRHYE
jgi:hypothetical protein